MCVEVLSSLICQTSVEEIEFYCSSERGGKLLSWYLLNPVVFKWNFDGGEVEWLDCGSWGFGFKMLQ